MEDSREKWPLPIGKVIIKLLTIPIDSNVRHGLPELHVCPLWKSRERYPSGSSYYPSIKENWHSISDRRAKTILRSPGVFFQYIFGQQLESITRDSWIIRGSAKYRTMHVEHKVWNETRYAGKAHVEVPPKATITWQATIHNRSITWKARSRHVNKLPAEGWVPSVSLT